MHRASAHGVAVESQPCPFLSAAPIRREEPRQQGVACRRRRQQQRLVLFADAVLIFFRGGLSSLQLGWRRQRRVSPTCSRGGISHAVRPTSSSHARRPSIYGAVHSERCHRSLCLHGRDVHLHEHPEVYDASDEAQYSAQQSEPVVVGDRSLVFALPRGKVLSRLCLQGCLRLCFGVPLNDAEAVELRRWVVEGQREKEAGWARATKKCIDSPWVNYAVTPLPVCTVRAHG